MEILVQAPTRICLVGGGTDVNPYAAVHQGALINVAIDKRHRVRLCPRPDRRILLNALGGVEELDLDTPLRLGEERRFDLIRAVIQHFAPALESGFALAIESDVQDSCGLGTSGSVGVALIGAFTAWLGREIDREQAARLAFELETVKLGWAGGKQDQWAAAYGGLSLTLFGPGEAVRVEPLRLSVTELRRLREHLLLVYVGGSRASAELQVSLQAQMKESRDSQQALNELKALTLQARPLLAEGDFPALGEVLHQGWLAKKRSSPRISTPPIDEIYQRCREAGALGGKLIGAGAAGYLYFLCPPERQTPVLAAARELAATPVDFQFDTAGLKVSILAHGREG